MLDAIIIVFYFLLMLSIGVYSFRKRKASGSDGFFVAGRKAGIVLVTGSLAATFIGSSVVIGMVGSGYRMGLPGVWWLLVGAIGLIILGLFLAKKVRRVGVYTLPELLEKQYGSKAKLLASLVIVASWIAICAAQILAAGNVYRSRAFLCSPQFYDQFIFAHINPIIGHHCLQSLSPAVEIESLSAYMKFNHILPFITIIYITISLVHPAK